MDQCHCVSTGAPLAKVQAIAHKKHWDYLLPQTTTYGNGNSSSSSGEQMDYANIPLGKCTQLLGTLEGNTCYVLYDKILMSMVLMVINEGERERE
jgi:hypothetical protein